MGKKVLTVDDSQTMRDMLSLTLKNAGFEVADAEDGQIAMEKLGDGEFDLVITDVNMPNMDGITLTRNIRRNDRHKGTPVLILTTESAADRKAEGKEAGAAGWIVKPFNPEKLLEIVGKVCA